MDSKIQNLKSKIKLIVGLGNPGKKYERTRHNAGFMVMDALIEELGLTWEESKKFKAEIIKNGDTIYAKPLTYMNLSGESVRKILAYYGTAKEELAKNLIVIHDEIDVDFGKFKIATDSRAAGHNGVQSIIDHLGTKKFKRYRLGVRTEALKQVGAEKFVLEKFKKEEMEKLSEIINPIVAEIKKETAD